MPITEVGSGAQRASTGKTTGVDSLAKAYLVAMRPLLQLLMVLTLLTAIANAML